MLAISIVMVMLCFMVVIGLREMEIEMDGLVWMDGLAVVSLS